VFVNARGEPMSRWGFAYVLHQHAKMASKKCPSLPTKKLFGTIRIGDEVLQVGDGQPGPNTLRLREALTDIQLGKVEDRYGWRTPV
jgi:hypothetical protein